MCPAPNRVLPDGSETRLARRSVGAMRRVVTGLSAAMLLAGAMTACSSGGSDGDDDAPTRVGGINGPARVVTDDDGADIGRSED